MKIPDRLVMQRPGSMAGMPDDLHPVWVRADLPSDVSPRIVTALAAVRAANTAYNQGETDRARALYARVLSELDRAKTRYIDIHTSVFQLADVEFQSGDTARGRRALKLFLRLSQFGEGDDARLDELVRAGNYRLMFSRVLDLDGAHLRQNSGSGGVTDGADTWELIGLKRGASGHFAAAATAFRNAYACAPPLGGQAWLSDLGLAYLAGGDRDGATALLFAAPQTDMFMEPLAARAAGVILAAWSGR